MACPMNATASSAAISSCPELLLQPCRTQRGDPVSAREHPNELRRGWLLPYIQRLLMARPTVEADQVILTLSFSILRCLDYSLAGFDRLKKRIAI